MSRFLDVGLWHVMPWPGDADSGLCVFGELLVVARVLPCGTGALGLWNGLH